VGPRAGLDAVVKRKIPSPVGSRTCVNSNGNFYIDVTIICCPNLYNEKWGTAGYNRTVLVA
jgi:hypothetical protein